MAGLMKKNETTSVWWWLGWIVLTIVSFFLSCYFWTGFIARHAGGMDQPGVPALWVTAVFGSWMVFLVPLIIVMYNKVDKAYEDARLTREKAQSQKAEKEFKARNVIVERTLRILKKGPAAKLKKFQETIRRGHLVTVTLNSGKKVKNVFILDKKEVLGVYGVEKLSFDIQDIVDVEPVADEEIPHFKPEEWLRLDGVGGEGSYDR